MTTSPFTRPAVLVVPLESVSRLYKREGFYCDKQDTDLVMKAIEVHGRFLQRDEAEQDAGLKQIVAYGLIRNHERILCVRRARNNRRSNLRLRYTVLFGGHVDDADRSSRDPLRDCLLRELREELAVVPPKLPNLMGCVADPSSFGGQLHLGVIFEVCVDTGVINVPKSCDKEEFTYGRLGSSYSLTRADEIEHSIDSFDPWSALVLSSAVFKRKLNANRSFHHQLQLPLCR
jgi:predicted NUDIX family phosphoesterase